MAIKELSAMVIYFPLLSKLLKLSTQFLAVLTIIIRFIVFIIIVVASQQMQQSTAEVERELIYFQSALPSALCHLFGSSHTESRTRNYSSGTHL
jgi:hypothetical protein